MREKLITTIDKLLSAGRPFLVFRYPRQEEVVILAEPALKSRTDKIAVLSFSKFEDTENQFLKTYEVISRFRFVKSPLFSSGIEVTTNDYERKVHLELVEKGVKTIKNGALKKVVLSRKQKVKKPINKVDSFLAACGLYPDAFCYLLSTPEDGIWLGATPEVLVKFRSDRYETMSLAGTRLADEIDDMPWTEKEFAEQKIVTDYIIGRLEELQVHDINVEGPITARAGALVHLRSDISGKLPEVNQKQRLVQALHPTPAVCGYPLAKAKNFISKHENYDRSLYTGYIGISVPDLPETYFVNLRCMRFVEEGVEIFVGGGITADSDPESEWEETVNKVQTMASILVEDT